MDEQLQEKFRRVRAIISDVDGVLTDGSIYIGADHFELKRFTVEDGVGAAFARLAELPLALISGRVSEATSARAEQLRIQDVYQGYLNKVEPFNLILEKYGLGEEDVAYIGDGLIDLPLLERVGMPVSVPHAPEMVREKAAYVTENDGGEGVLKEVVELVLRSQGRFDAVFEKMKNRIYRAGIHEG